MSTLLLTPACVFAGWAVPVTVTACAEAGIASAASAATSTAARVNRLRPLEARLVIEDGFIPKCRALPPLKILKIK